MLNLVLGDPSEIGNALTGDEISFTGSEAVARRIHAVELSIRGAMVSTGLGGC